MIIFTRKRGYFCRDETKNNEIIIFLKFGFQLTFNQTTL